MNIVLSSLTQIFNRDLALLEKELHLYEEEHTIWKIPPGVKNSAGTLALHICGNLKHFIGATLGDSGYQRHREAEFNDRDIPVDDIIVNINETKAVIENTLATLNPSDLENDFPIEMWGRTISNAFMLIHLSAHLDWHLGQINYHRRMLGN